MAGNSFRSDRERNLIAELTRLIGQAYPGGNSAPADNRFREETSSDAYDEPQGLPPEPRLQVYQDAPEQT